MRDALQIGVERPASNGVVRHAPTGGDIRTKLRAKATEYEAMFISQMLKPMFDGTQADAPFGAGNAEDVWQSFQLEEYGKAISRAGGIGLADGIYRQLLAVQEMKGE